MDRSPDICKAKTNRFGNELNVAEKVDIRNIEGRLQSSSTSNWLDEVSFTEEGRGDKGTGYGEISSSVWTTME